MERGWEIGQWPWEIQAAASRIWRPTSIISRKNRGLWTLLINKERIVKCNGSFWVVYSSATAMLKVVLIRLCRVKLDYDAVIFVITLQKWQHEYRNSPVCMVDISHWAPGKASVVCWSTKYIHGKECFKNTFKKIRLCLTFSRGRGGGGSVAGAVLGVRT